MAVPALVSLLRLQVLGSWAGSELGPRIVVLWAEGRRARWHLGSWLWQPPLQRLVLVSGPHGGVMGRTWTFLPLRSGQQQQLQAISSNSSTVAGGGGERSSERGEFSRGRERTYTQLLKKPLQRYAGSLPKETLAKCQLSPWQPRGPDFPASLLCCPQLRSL